MPARRKTVQELTARGTLRRDRHKGRPHHTDLATLPPAAPESLTEGARREWNRIIAVMGASGRLTALDAVVLQQYCELSAELAEAPRDFMAAKHTQLRLCASELGLTPHARLKLPEPKRPQGNPFEAFD